MINFFFYNNLNNINNIKNISCEFNCVTGYIFINDFDIKQNKLKFDKTNKEILKGKAVTFNMPLEKLLLKLSNINNIKYNKKSYTLEKINVITYEKGILDCYIIY